MRKGVIKTKEVNASQATENFVRNLNFIVIRYIIKIYPKRTNANSCERKLT